MSSSLMQNAPAQPWDQKPGAARLMASSPSLLSHALAVGMLLIHDEIAPWLQLGMLPICYKATPRLQL